MTTLTKPWIEHLEERLKTVDDFAGYLSAAFTEGKDTFYLAVRDVTLITHRRAATAALEQERKRIWEAVKVIPQTERDSEDNIIARPVGWFFQDVMDAIGDDKEQDQG